MEFLRTAVKSLPCAELEVVAVSPIYETAPQGGPEQGPYLNLVVEIKSSFLPRELLERCLNIEKESGRVRRERWGPRTLDIDVLWIEGISVDEPDLVVPHPRMKLRRFVMIPLGDIAPEMLDGWEDPDDGEVKKLGKLQC